MSTSRLYRTLSILIVLTLLVNATSLLAATPIAAAPLKSEVKAQRNGSTARSINAVIISKSNSGSV